MKNLYVCAAAAGATPMGDESSLEELSTELLDELHLYYYYKPCFSHIYVIMWLRPQQEMFGQKAFLAK